MRQAEAALEKEGPVVYERMPEEKEGRRRTGLGLLSRLERLINLPEGLPVLQLLNERGSPR